jgi:uncharacterized C2H2 Zn-finger protein
VAQSRCGFVPLRNNLWFAANQKLRPLWFLAHESLLSVVHKCSVCGMVFVNSGELAEHSATVHRDTMLQCQSCGRFFGSRQELDAHAAEFHAASRNFSKQTPDEEKETSLLRKADKEEKARRRTRGPYRKSHAA